MAQCIGWEAHWTPDAGRVATGIFGLKPLQHVSARGFDAVVDLTIDKAQVGMRPAGIVLRGLDGVFLKDHRIYLGSESQAKFVGQVPETPNSKTTCCRLNKPRTSLFEPITLSSASYDQRRMPLAGRAILRPES